MLLPSETSLDDCNTILVDSDGSETAEVKNRKNIKFSNSILLLYDMLSQTSVDRLTDYWLPIIQEVNPEVRQALIQFQDPGDNSRDETGLDPQRFRE